MHAPELGTTASRPVGKAEVAGVAVPPATRRILLAVDLTPASSGAVTEALRIAGEQRAHLIVLSVVERTNLHLPGGVVRRVDQERDRLQSGLRRIVDQARIQGIEATYLVWEGDPAESILEAAIAEAADLIILGSRRIGRVRRLLLGSVSTRVAHDATCRVVVVPKP